MPTKIIIVRHGETQDNVERRLQGSRNTPLNENGHLQAQLVAERLSTETITAIYSSDQDRAHTTATYIARALKQEIISDPRLREDNLGAFEGWKWESEHEELKPLWEEMMEARVKGDLTWRKHKGDSLAQFHERLRSFHQHLEQDHPSGTVILVTHGGTKNRYLEVLNLKATTDDYVGFGNTSITILEKKSSIYQIVSLNDTSHLSSGTTISKTI